MIFFENHNQLDLSLRSHIIRSSIIYFGVLILVSLIGFGLYALFFSDNSAIVENNNQAKGIQTFDVSDYQENINSEKTEVEQALIFLEKERIEAGDKDGDGLTDEKEKTLGTNFENQDSDADGLSDGEEVSIFLTNPLLKDSDEDGIDDGIEAYAYQDEKTDDQQAETPSDVVQ